MESYPNPKGASNSFSLDCMDTPVGPQEDFSESCLTPGAWLCNGKKRWVEGWGGQM